MVSRLGRHMRSGCAGGLPCSRDLDDARCEYAALFLCACPLGAAKEPLA